MRVRLSDTRSAGKRRGAARRVGACLVAATLAACASAASAPPGGSDTGDRVEEVLGSLDLRERVGQLVMVWMSGGYASRTDEEMRRIEALVADEGIGGIVISLGTPHAYVSRLNRLQAAADVPLLVAADFEAGPGFRVGGIYALPSGMDMGGATMLPPAMAFGAAGDAALAYEAGRVTGLEARALGVHVSFAPVLDVNNNPDNPIINVRSYGEDAARVAELGTAYIRGARAAGLQTTAKHFPGHGDTGTDSHVALPIVTGDRARLDALELVPFRRAIVEGVDGIMTAHVSAPGILGPDAPPATLSPYFMTRLLRDELGFDGVLFTDALDMAAIVDGFGPGEAAVRALEAGADVLLMPPEPAAAIEAVVAAVAAGRLTEERIAASARRVLRMKERAGLGAGRRVDPERVTEIVGIAAHRELADTVARRSLTLVRDLDGSFPLDTAAVRRILSVTWARDADVVAGRAFDARLAGSLDVRRARLGPDSPVEAVRSVVGRIDDVDAVVLSLHASPGAPAEDGEPHPLDLVLAAATERGVPGILVSFGSPYALSAVRDPWTYLIAWSGARAAQHAAAEALIGRAAVDGKLPISLPPLHGIGEGRVASSGRTAPPVVRTVAPGEATVRSAGMDSAALARVDRLIAEAIRDSVTPGAALAVGRRGRIVRLRGYGRLDYAAGSAAVTPETPYDLASLTKVVATTTAVMTLVDDGRLALDDRVGSHLDEWSRGWKADATIRDLLLHRAGLPPFRPFWRELEGREAYRDAIAALPPEYEIGSRTVYSDLGLIALQLVIEEVAGETLDAFAGRAVLDPLGMSSTRFTPPPPARAAIAPTEVDTTFRHRHVRGEVHDENAFALGGVAGHAGLFSSARDLARFGEWILEAARAGRGLEAAAARPGRDALPAPATVAEFTRRAGPGSSRALGWDTPSGRSSSGRFFSPDSFGHTGFTGTSIWIDPARDLFVVLLTNRVNPTRAERGHIPLRRAVHDAVAAAIRDAPVEPSPPPRRQERP